MQPHEERVIAERDDLAEKIKRLDAFQDTETFAGLPEPDAILLSVQKQQMFAYLQTLEMRIERFAA